VDNKAPRHADKTNTLVGKIGKSIDENFLITPSIALIMKIILVNILLVLFGTNFESYAQVARVNEAAAPNLFDKYPAELHISATEILNLLKNNANDVVAIHSADGTVFNGHVSQNQNSNKDAQTVSIELKDFPPHTMLIVNRINKDGKIIYRAHILNHKNPDAYVLKSFDEREFVFVKTTKGKIVTE
jgi:hypothetical protein